MYKLTQMIQNKVAVSLTAIIMVALFSLALAPATSAITTTDFGLGQTETGLSGTLGNQPLIKTVTSIINVALGLLGIIAVVIVLIGGFKWMTAGGNEENVEAGRKYIVSGIIGLAIILSAFAITKFVIGNLSAATGSGQVSGTF